MYNRVEMMNNSNRSSSSEDTQRKSATCAPFRSKKLSPTPHNLTDFHTAQTRERKTPSKLDRNRIHLINPPPLSKDVASISLQPLSAATLRRLHRRQQQQQTHIKTTPNCERISNNKCNTKCNNNDNNNNNRSPELYTKSVSTRISVFERLSSSSSASNNILNSRDVSKRKQPLSKATLRRIERRQKIQTQTQKSLYSSDKDGDQNNKTSNAICSHITRSKDTMDNNKNNKSTEPLYMKSVSTRVNVFERLYNLSKENKTICNSSSSTVSHKRSSHNIKRDIITTNNTTNARKTSTVKINGTYSVSSTSTNTKKNKMTIFDRLYKNPKQPTKQVQVATKKVRHNVVTPTSSRTSQEKKEKKKNKTEVTDIRHSEKKSSRSVVSERMYKKAPQCNKSSIEEETKDKLIIINNYPSLVIDTDTRSSIIQHQDNVVTINTSSPHHELLHENTLVSDKCSSKDTTNSDNMIVHHKTDIKNNDTLPIDDSGAKALIHHANDNSSPLVVEAEVEMNDDGHNDDVLLTPLHNEVHGDRISAFVNKGVNQDAFSDTDSDSEITSNEDAFQQSADIIGHENFENNNIHMPPSIEKNALISEFENTMEKELTSLYVEMNKSENNLKKAIESAAAATTIQRFWRLRYSTDLNKCKASNNETDSLFYKFETTINNELVDVYSSSDFSAEVRTPSVQNDVRDKLEHSLAVTIIQRSWRHNNERKKRIKEEFRAAIMIQRKWLLHRKLLVMEAVICIQKWIRCVKYSKEYNQKRLSSIRIQSAIRRHFVLRELNVQHCNANKIINVWKKYMFARKMKAATLIQSAWRGYFKQFDFKITLLSLYIDNKLAIRIQRRWRSYSMRTSYKQLQTSSLNMQRIYRYYRLRNHILNEQRAAKQRFRAAVVIQCLWRGYAAQRQRENTTLMGKSAIRLQTWTRSLKCRRAYDEKVRSIIFLQSIVRRHIAQYDVERKHCSDNKISTM